MFSQQECLNAAGTKVQSTLNKMKSWDGSELVYRSWQPALRTDRAVILLHRGHEHSGRLEDVVADLNLPGVSVFAWDARGHGLTEGKRGFAPDFSCLTRDLDAFVKHISAEHGIAVENMVVMAQSVAAVVLATWVHDYAPRIRGMILVGPAFRVKLYVPFAVPLLRALRAVHPQAAVRSYVTGKMLTHDLKEARLYDCDSLVSKTISVNVLLGLHDTAARVVEDAAAIVTPTLVLVAGQDAVVDRRAQEKFFKKLSSPKKELQIYPHFYHDILHETQRHMAIEAARRFMKEVWREEPVDSLKLVKSGQDICESERTGASKPVSKRSFCPKRLKYSLIKYAFRTIGLLSDGIRIGWKYGFDSGRSLDYIYENKARGLGIPGKLLDRMYLDTTGWRTIRQRKASLEAAIQKAIESSRRNEGAVQLLDIATGGGRYVLSALQNTSVPVCAQLRDYDERSLQAAKRNALAMGLDDIEFLQADAFDGQALSELRPRPDVAVVSGLYELFSDNEMILRSLRGLASSMAPGGYLIYTNQPWHPQLEFIARVLTNREGEPWQMRCRSQAEMDALVRVAGFEKVSMETDQYGIFTVSVARKPFSQALEISA